MLRPLNILLVGVLVLSALVLTVSAQEALAPAYPGDPVGPDDLVFVDLDAGLSVSCGITRANNIRCWGANNIGPVHAEGFTDVAVGNGHSCGLKLDGTVHCWATTNTRGRLDIPIETDGSSLRLSSIDSFTDGYHTCGIRVTNGSAVCWGWDFAGQSSGQSSEPNTFSYDYSGDAFSQLSPGIGHTCGVLSEGEDRGKIRCWGGYNNHGQNEVPTDHANASFKSVHPGQSFTCAIIAGGEQDGKVICWGASSTGVLTETPSDVKFSQISAGRFHVCGVTTEMTVRCWGGNDDSASTSQEDFGQSDIPSEYQSATFSKVGAARYHTCGILDGQSRQTEGEVVCWGAEFDPDPLKPHLIDGGRTTPSDYFYPSTSSLPQIETGSFFNCGLTVENDAICWGGSSSARPFTQGPFKSLAVGKHHTCGVRGSGHVNCWGFNTNLQSSGWGLNLSVDLQAASALVENLTTDYTFESVSAAYLHTCGILDGNTAGQTEGEVICWGHNSNGQATPPEMTFSSISAGFYHACGILDAQNGQSSGKAVCWGAENNLDANDNVVPTIYNFDTQADFGQADVPEALSDVAFRSISASRYHTCAVREYNGKIACWSNAQVGTERIADIPEEISRLRFSAVAASWYATCGITTDGLLKCWSGISNPIVRNFDVPSDYVDTEFVSVSASVYHVCATKSNGRVFCWGADADTSTPELEIYKGSTIINTRQAWVPRSFRARPRPPRSPGPPFVPTAIPTATSTPTTTSTPTPTPTATSTPAPASTATPTATSTPAPTSTATPTPTSTPAPASTPAPPPAPASQVLILRIEPAIRGVDLRPGERVRLSVEVYGRQDVRDDSLGDRPEVTFEWSTESRAPESLSEIGSLEETVWSGSDRELNGEADDRRVMYVAPLEPDRFRVEAALDIGTECLGKREGETDEDSVERCTAVFDVTVSRPSAEEPAPVPPRDPSGDIPDVIVGDDGTNYEVIAPEDGGEFITEKCSLKIPKGAVNDAEVIGVSVAELEDPEDRIEVDDPRFMTEGVQCRIDAISVDRRPLIDYRLLLPGEICMPLPDAFRPKAVNALVGAINPDATLTALGSRVYLATPAGALKVCGTISSLSATTTVALRAEVARELPPTPVPTPDAGEIETGGGTLGSNMVLLALLLGVTILASGSFLVINRRRELSEL